MSTATLRTVHDGLADAKAFAARHVIITDVVMRRIDNPILMVESPRLTVGVFEGGWHEALIDVVMVARGDGFPVRVDHLGSYLWVDVDFDGLVLRFLDYHGTCSARYGVEALAACPVDDLDLVLDAVVESRRAGS